MRARPKTAFPSIALAAVGVLALVPPALAGLEIRTETTFADSSGPRERGGKMLLDEKSIRMELPGQDAADGRGLTLIFRADPGVVYVLDEKDRSYMEMDRRSAEAMRAKIEAAKREMDAQMAKLPATERLAMEKMLAERGFGGNAPPPPAIRTEPTDQKATVAGFPCRDFKVFEGKRRIGDACVADWSATGTTRSDFDGLRAFAAFEEEMAKAMAFGGPKRDPNEMTRLFDLGGVPVRMRSERDGKVVTETRLVEIKRRDLPADAFKPPADWKKRSPDAAP